MNLILKEDSIEDIDMLDDYNKEYLTIYKDFKPFVTRENYKVLLKQNELKKQGINNDGVKEIFYWLIEDNKIIGHASLRLNPEVDEKTYKYSGHVMYGIVPSKRGKGYGSYLCHLLIKKALEFGLNTIFITCRAENEASNKVIENNFGEFIETLPKDNNNEQTNRYIVDVKKSILKFDEGKEIYRII